MTLFAISLMFSGEVLAVNDSLEMVLVNKKTVEVSPGSLTNVLVMLKNKSVTRKDIFLKVKTPNGMSQMYDSLMVTVEDQSQEMKIFSFNIPETMKSGNYIIHVEAYTKNNKIGEADVKLTVKPRYEILVQVRGTPRYVYSGDKVTVEFVIQNLSNAKANVLAEIVNINQTEKKTFSIDADSFLVIPITAITAKDLAYYIRNSISLTATVLEDPEVKSYASGIFDVLPFNQEKFDAYTRIPVRITTLMMYNSQFPGNNFGAMFNIQGTGILSKKKKSTLEFLFRGPNRQGNPILGTSDAYYIKYLSSKTKAVAGDYVYALSQLTEGSRNGRGIDYEIKGRKLSVGSFVNFPRFYPELKQISSVYGSYYPNKRLRLNTGLLNKDYTIGKTAQLATASGRVNIASGTNLEFEYAMGKGNNKLTRAYSTFLEANILKTRVFLNYTEADKTFPGYITNTRYISTGINANLGKKLGVSANYNLNNFHMALDTIFANAPFSENLNLSLGYAFNYSSSLSLGVFRTGREDIQIPKRFKYDETTLRLTLQSKISSFEFRMYGSYGQMNNLANPQQGEIKNIANGEFSVDYKFNQHFFVNGFVSYVGSQQYLASDYTLFFYGGVMNLTYPRVNIEFQYQNNYEIVEYYRNRSLLSLKSRYYLGIHHEISAGVNYYEQNRYLNKTQIIASLNYTYILRAPVAKRDDVGSIQGKVINKGVSRVEGLVFSIDGNIAMTDKDGNFEFPAINAGSYMLFMDNSMSDLNTIAETPGPYKVEIIAGQKYNFTVALTKSVEINGKIIMEEDVNKNDKGYVPLTEELSTLIVEASSETEVYRVFTNPDKTFSFQDLRPGKWKVKIYDRGIPKGYKLIKDEFYLDLAPEKKENIDVVIKKSSRKIQFQTH